MSKVSTSNSAATAVILSSPALVNQAHAVRIVENAKRKRRRLSSVGRLKDMLVPWMVWFLRKAPRSLGLLPPAVIVGMAHVFYGVPGNPLRRAVDDMVSIGRSHHQARSSRSLYRAFLRNLFNVVALTQRLYCNGWESVIDDVVFPDADVVRIRRLVEEYGGVVVAVPHNLGSTFSGIRFCKAFHSVLLSKNSASVSRTRIALDFFERLDAKVLLVRDGSAMQISRNLIKLLRSGKVVAATMDRLAGKKDGIAATMFGQQVYLPSWATRIPTAVGVPIVPTYIHSQGAGLRATFGVEVVTRDAVEATRHIAAFLEERILEDPASWAFLAEKRWARVLSNAARA